MDSPKLEMKCKYLVEIREVHIATHEILADEGTSDEVIIQMALDDADNELTIEYSHTMDSNNHTVGRLT